MSIKRLQGQYEDLVQEIHYHPNDVLQAVYRIEKSQDELEKCIDNMEKKIQITEEHRLAGEMREMKDLESKVTDYKLENFHTDNSSDLLEIFSVLSTIDKQLEDIDHISEQFLYPTSNTRPRL